MIDETDDAQEPNAETTAEQPVEPTEPTADDQPADAETSPAVEPTEEQPAEPDSEPAADEPPQIVEPPIDLNARLTKARTALAATGGQEQVGALNELEHLTGRLKFVLPSAITVIQDPELTTDLQTLLALL